jgi:hypothetical protein
MQISRKFISIAAIAVTSFGLQGSGQTLPDDVKSKIDARVKQMQSWSTDVTIVSAVKAHNARPPAEAQSMTNERWKTLSILDPSVRAFTKNSLAQYLKGKKDDQITECFVSAADGTKVAFLSKTTSWSHADKAKHTVPMSGKTWVGPVEVDESTGQQQVQIGLPVLDGKKPIGSIVVGLSISKLR